jgi:hypothetical protein
MAYPVTISDCRVSPEDSNRIEYVMQWNGEKQVAVTPRGSILGQMLCRAIGIPTPRPGTTERRPVRPKRGALAPVLRELREREAARKQGPGEGHTKGFGIPSGDGPW